MGAPLPLGVADPYRNRFLLHLVIMPNLIILGEATRAMEISQKKMTPRVLPFKVTLRHLNRHGSIGCEFLLVVSSNHGPISYIF